MISQVTFKKNQRILVFETFHKLIVKQYFIHENYQTLPNVVTSLAYESFSQIIWTVACSFQFPSQY